MANHHPSPPMQMQMHHGPPVPPPQPVQQQMAGYPLSRQLPLLNESVWLQIGNFAEILGMSDDAMQAYEHALRANPQSVPAMMGLSVILKKREDFAKSAEYLQAVLKIEPTNGEAWGSLGHCFLMMDDLSQAYAAYQSALMNLRDVKDPKLWYGIGILYDRYGSLEHAEEAFSQVMRMQPDFEKASEVYFRLGIIYKQQQKFGQSLECFKYIVQSPPNPLTEGDIWFQIGHVYEQQKDFDSAKAAYQRVLDLDPNHAKVLQQLGWLYHQLSNSFASQEKAIEYLERSVAADNLDAQSWYLLGRCYMSQQKYPKAYEAYQQAVYRDGRNPHFWCSIGVLYYQINQYRDALDAYSRAIRLDPFLSEVWYDLGTLYESCNNQISDALDAYQRAAELAPNNPHIKARLQLLRAQQQNGGMPPASAPMPTDVQVQSYPGSGAPGPAPPQWPGSAPAQQQQQQQQQQPPPGPPLGSSPGGWGGQRLNEINPHPQPPNPYEGQRGEPFRGPAPPPPMPRQRSPGVEGPQVRPFPIDPNRPSSLRRPPSPPHYQQGPPPPAQQGPPPPLSRPPPPNPQYGAPPPPVSMAPSMPSNGVHGPHPPPPPPHHGGPMGPYRAASPRQDGRPPMHDNRMPSPKSAYPQHQPPYHHPEPPQSSMDGGAPPPPPPPPAMGPGPDPRDPRDPRDHDRPPSVGPKRMREWEDEAGAKKPATEEARARLDDHRHRRPSTPPRDAFRRNSSEARRLEEQRRMEERRVDDQRRADEMRRAEEQQRHAHDNYHPSEAAHHPQHHLPPLQQGPMPQGPPPTMPSIIHDAPPPPPQVPKEYSSDDRRIEHPPPPPPPPQQQPVPPQLPLNEERAARKVDVDEDYDGPEDDKKAVISGPGSAPNSAGGEIKTTTPTSATMNGMIGPAPKIERAD